MAGCSFCPAVRAPAGPRPVCRARAPHRSQELAMSATVKRRHLALALLPFLAAAPSGTTLARAESCAAPADWYLNPFTARSAHHRPIGTGARYAAAAHPATRDWLKARSFGISGGRPGSMAVARAEAWTRSAPFGRCGMRPGSGLPLTLRLPRCRRAACRRRRLGPCPDQPAIDLRCGDGHRASVRPVPLERRTAVGQDPPRLGHRRSRSRHLSRPAAGPQRLGRRRPVRPPAQPRDRHARPADRACAADDAAAAGRLPGDAVDARWSCPRSGATR